MKNALFYQAKGLFAKKPMFYSVKYHVLFGKYTGFFYQG